MNQFYPNYPIKVYAAHNRALIYNCLRAKKEGFDVKLLIGDFPYLIEAHAAVLRMNSAFFEALLSKTWDRNPSKIVKIITNVAYDSFKLILDYLYTGKITLSGMNIEEVLTSSHNLQLSDLHSLTEDYLLSMLESNPADFHSSYFGNLAKKQKFTHISMLREKPEVSSNLYGESLYLFEKDDNLKVVVKSVVDNRWLFIDSLTPVHPKDDGFFTTSGLDVYVCDKEYMIVHGDQSPKDSFEVTMGVCFASGAVGDDIYLFGSKPIEFQRFNLTSRTFTKLPTPPENVRGCLGCSLEKSRKFVLVEKGFVHVCDVGSDCKDWKTINFSGDLNRSNVQILSVRSVNSSDLISISYKNGDASPQELFVWIGDMNSTTYNDVIF